MLRQPPPSTSSSGQGTPLGAGGLAGVASTFKGPSIKVYKDQKKYQLWEFIFDLKSAMAGQQGGAPGSQNPLGSPQNPTNPLGLSNPTPGAPAAPPTPAPGTGQPPGQQQN
jgi:hypothetical protein